MRCSDDERALIEAICGGDYLASDRFASAYRDVVLAQLRGMGAGEDAEDLAQDVLVSAIATIAKGRLGGRSAISTWLYAIGHHKYVDLLRSRGSRGAAVAVGEAGSRQAEPGRPGAARSDRLATPDQDAVVLLEELIASLPPRQAILFRRVDVEGVKIGVVADEIGLSISHVYVCLKQARAFIHAALVGPDAATGSRPRPSRRSGAG